MTPERGFQHRVVRTLANAAIDMLDRQPAAARANRIVVRFTEVNAPDIMDSRSIEERERAWEAIDAAASTGLFLIDYARHRRHGELHEIGPKFVVPPDAEAEAGLRERLGRPPPGIARAQAWREAAVEAGLVSFEDAAALGVVSVPGRSAREVALALACVRGIADEQLLLREASAKLFWGQSKVLDGKEDVVARVLGRPECPFPERPVALQVHFDEHPREILFVENWTTFESLRRKRLGNGLALALSSGYRGTARRLRSPEGVSTYYSRACTIQPDAIEAFEALLSEGSAPVWFWGDLDHAGMGILRALRASFATASAWRPGYAPMLAHLIGGEGHAPGESRKRGQRTVEFTGCEWADAHLIPALASTGRFLDQEAIDVAELG